MRAAPCILDVSRRRQRVPAQRQGPGHQPGRVSATARCSGATAALVARPRGPGRHARRRRFGQAFQFPAQLTSRDHRSRQADIVALGEPLIEFNQARADGSARVPAGLRRRHVEHGDRRGAARRARRATSRAWATTPSAACSSTCGPRKASTCAAWRSMPTRRPASISSRTARRATSSRTCARAPRRAACGPKRCRSTSCARRALLHVSGISQAISRQRMRRGVRRDRRRRSAAGALVTYDPNLRLEALAAAAGARDDPGDDGALRLVPAEPRRCARAVRRRRRRSGDRRLPSRRRAGRGLEAGRRRLHRLRRRAPAARSPRTASRRSTRRARATASTARSRRACSPATIRSPPRAMPTSRRRSRRPVSARWRRCRATPTCAPRWRRAAA